MFLLQGLETLDLHRHKPNRKNNGIQSLFKSLCPPKIMYTFTGVASFLILPHETASSGFAPLSLPSKSHAVLMKTAKSAPFLC